MPSISRVNTAAQTNALENLQFATLQVPSLVSLYMSAGTAGESASFLVDSNQFMANGEINLEAGNEIVDLERDGLLLQEVVPAGKMFLVIPIVTSTVQWRLLIEPVAG